MISAGSAVSDSRTAPSTDCSASRFCGGATGPSGMRGTGEWPLPLAWVRSGSAHAAGGVDPRSARSANTCSLEAHPATCGRFGSHGAGTTTAARWAAVGKARRARRARLLLLDDHGLDVAVTPGSTSTTTMRVPTVGSARRGGRRGCRWSRPRASLMASAMSCEVTEPNRRPSSPAWWAIVSTVLLSSAAFSSRLGGGVGDRALGGDGAALGRLDRAARRRLGELARDQEVAQVALGDVDDGALGRRAFSGPASRMAWGMPG